MQHHVFSFRGRISRFEYLLSCLGFLIIRITFGLLIRESNLFYVFGFPAIWFIISQSARREHDLGNFGVELIIPFRVIWLLLVKGEEGDNQYGKSPNKKKFIKNKE